MNNMGDVIKEKRKEKGMSVQKLSEASGLARSTIYRIENGQIGSLDLKNTAKLLGPLNMSIDELIDEDSLGSIEEKATYKQMIIDEKFNKFWNGADPIKKITEALDQQTKDGEIIEINAMSEEEKKLIMLYRGKEYKKLVSLMVDKMTEGDKCS